MIKSIALCLCLALATAPGCAAMTAKGPPACSVTDGRAARKAVVFDEGAGGLAAGAASALMLEREDASGDVAFWALIAVAVPFAVSSYVGERRIRACEDAPATAPVTP